MEVAFDVLSRWFRLEPAAFFISGVFHSPRIVISFVSGLTRMGCVSGRSLPPR